MKLVYQTKKKAIKNIVIFTGGEHPSIEKVKSFLQNFSKETFYLAADSGLFFLEECGYIADKIIGDMDSIKNHEKLNTYQQEKISIYPKEKDYSDTELALLYAKEIEPKANVILIGASGGRLDHFLSILNITRSKIVPFPDFWLCPENIFILIGDKIKKINISQIVDEFIFSIFVINKYTCFSKICSTNLKWPIDKLKWSFQNSLSNKCTCDNFELLVRRGKFLFVMNYDNSVLIELS